MGTTSTAATAVTTTTTATATAAKTSASPAADAATTAATASATREQHQQFGQASGRTVGDQTEMESFVVSVIVVTTAARPAQISRGSRSIADQRRHRRKVERQPVALPSETPVVHWHPLPGDNNIIYS